MNTMYKVTAVVLTTVIVFKSSASVIYGTEYNNDAYGNQLSPMQSVFNRLPPCSSIYIPEMGMYLNEFLSKGGPMYRRLYSRLASSTVNWNADLKTQTVPIITRQELEAFYKEQRFLLNLNSYLEQRYSAGIFQFQSNHEAYQHGYCIGAYSNFANVLTAFSLKRPDAIQ